MTIIIRPETERDHAAIGNVHRAAFGSEAEAQLVDELRDGGFADVSLVAELEGEVIGHILFSRVEIVTPEGAVTAASLGPVAVAPQFQRQGVGRQLMEAGLAACRARGHRIAVVLGHPTYYPRFGFSAEKAEPLSSPFGGGEAWMALELVPGSLEGIQGRVEYPPPFGRFE